ncbi:MAG: glycerol-3-phosphate acyltransferase [Bacteroidetes bacterium]|nr:MAG: glycerol-3-phosphate acyltransferase [Bacteroidota bacterium]
MESVQHYIQEGILYEPVIPDIHDWPIAKLFRKKSAFLEEVIEETLAQLNRKAGAKGIIDVIEKTMYLERIRMTEEPWKVDPKDESRFWSQIKKELVTNEQVEANPEAFVTRNNEMLERIVSRYAHEIASTFKPGSYHFAKRFLPLFFSTLLNASAGKTIRSVIYHNVHLQERVNLVGETEAIRNLSKRGTIVLVPTHLSNVDSILVGWGLHALGLPAFIYGAGLNLFNTQILGYFMNRLGAYKVDRRKKNPVYRETLNAYSTIALLEGVHSLFFPGGTRSRSGTIEKHLKLGLLGTAMEAQRRNFLQGARSGREKIFVVPLVMSYHFTLEAASLIKQHLTRVGQEQYYILDGQPASYTKFLRFVWTTFSSSSDIVLAFGKPMDIFGNFVDDEGNSLDHRGRLIDVKEYFMSRGKITEDVQRDHEYTRMLGSRIVERYHVENRVFSSHLVAFVAFQMLKRKFPSLDLFGLLRIPEDERTLPMGAYREALERVLARLRYLSDRSKVHLAPHLINDAATIIEHGIKNLGIYHAKRPLRYQNEHTLASDSMNLLYYYHNRLDGYELESLFD